jgi:hypothetical protein
MWVVLHVRFITTLNIKDLDIPSNEKPYFAQIKVVGLQDGLTIKISHVCTIFIVEYLRSSTLSGIRCEL